EVAVGERIAFPRIVQRGRAVHVLQALVEVAFAVRVERVGGGEALFHVDIDATQRVDDLLEAGEVHQGDVVDAYPGVALHRLNHQRNAAPGHGRVDLRVLVAGPTVLRRR